MPLKRNRQRKRKTSLNNTLVAVKANASVVSSLMILRHWTYIAEQSTKNLRAGYALV